MKQKKPSVRKWRGLTSTAAAVMALVMGASIITNVNADFINICLGTANSRLENTGGVYFASEFGSVAELVEAKDAVAEQLGAEGAVLLKNENAALPLDKNSETVTLWGLNSHTPTLGGLIGSSTSYDPATGQKSYGPEEALAERGFTLNQSMIDFYSQDMMEAYYRRGFGQTGHGLSPSFGMSYENPAQYAVGEADPALYTDELLQTANGTAAVVVISRDSSEVADYSTSMVCSTEGDSFERPLALSDYERGMIELAKAHSTKVVVLLNADNPMEVEELKQDDEIDAILWVGAPGMRGFLGVADVLSGDENPSGHLPDTYAVNSTSAPAMANFGLYLYSNSSVSDNPVLTEANKADWYVVENEGIYVGYKYYETRYEDAILGQGNADSTVGSSTGGAWSYADEVSYPFGYGLSYTTFEQTLDSVDVALGEGGTAVVTVTNTGDVAGKSAVQLYVQVPYVQGGVEKSAVQLLDFGKTQVLQPGESETVTISFDPRYMASYDENAGDGAWILDAGTYYFTVGNGAHEALNNILAAKNGTDAGLVSITEEEINADNVKTWALMARDEETYSENVQNALQDCDINNLIEGTVEYASRTDWSLAFQTVESITPTEEMMVGLTNQNYTLNANGEGTEWGVDSGLKAIDFMVTDPETGLCIGVKDWEDPAWDALVNQITLEEAVAMVEKGGEDFEALNSIVFPQLATNDGPVGYTFDQLSGYWVRWNESNANEPTYVTQEDEKANYAMNTLPTAPVVAATFNKDLVYRMGEMLGEDSLWANSNEIAAPGLNLHRTPYCGRNHEYYSEDSMLTNLMGAAVCAGGDTRGIMMEPKHFAFNHQELNRSGMSTFFNEQSARENELRCFQMALSENYAAGVMTGFNRIGTVFSGAHSGLQEQILRNEWGYTGWIVTDMFNGADYMNWRDTVAGGGLVCLTSTAYDSSAIGPMSSDANMALIEQDTNFQLKMKEGIRYLLYTAVDSNLMNNFNSETHIVYFLNWWQKALIAVNVLFVAGTAACAVKYGLEIKKSRKRGEVEA